MFNMLFLLFVFIVSSIVGYLLISRVPQLLHTPLMSMTNAVSGITLLGALMLFSHEKGIVFDILGAFAILFAIFNVVGGFTITDRMLKMFKTKR